MAKYKVDVVVTGIVTVEVEAENAQNAKDAAFEVVDSLSFARLSKIRTMIGCVEDSNHREVTFERPLYLHRHDRYTNRTQEF